MYLFFSASRSRDACISDSLRVSVQDSLASIIFFQYSESRSVKSSFAPQLARGIIVGSSGIVFSVKAIFQLKSKQIQRASIYFLYIYVIKK